MRPTGRRRGAPVPRPRAAGPLAASVLIHAAAIGSALWVAAADVRPPELALAAVEASVSSTASEGLDEPREEEALAPLPEALPPEEPPPEAPVVEAEPPETPAEELPVADALPRAEPPAAVPIEARTAPRRPPPPAAAPPVPRAAPPARSTASVATAEGEGPTPFATNRPPAYPPLAIERGWTGRVRLLLTLDEEGRVVVAEVEVGSGHAVLDEAALAAARGWRFAPARRGGTPIRFRLRVPVHFEPPPSPPPLPRETP